MRQSQLHHTIGRAVPNLAVGLRGSERLVLVAPGADHELPDTVDVVLLIGVLRCEPLIAVVVAVQHDIDPGLIQVGPELGRAGIVAMKPGAEARLVPVREGARVGMSGQILEQPRVLRRSRITATDIAALGVEGNDVPRAHIEAVVALGWIARHRSEVREVTRGTLRLVVVVPRSWPDDRFHPTP